MNLLDKLCQKYNSPRLHIPQNLITHCTEFSYKALTGFNPCVWKIPWRWEWLPTPVFWPGEFHGLYSPWGCKESDMTE